MLSFKKMCRLMVIGLALPRHENAPDYIRARGSDFTKGALCVRKNTVLNVRILSLMASMNISEFTALCPPKNCDSLHRRRAAEIGTLQTDWQIPSSNDIGLASLLPLYGAEITEIQNVGDAPNALIDWLKRVIPDNDMIVVSGGCRSAIMILSRKSRNILTISK